MRIVRDMEHAQILYVRSMTDTDVMHVAANHGMKPDAALFAHHDVADDHRGVFDEAGFGNGRSDALKGPDHVRTIGESVMGRKGLVDSVFRPLVD
jgi:hypothetical protein